MKGIKKRKDPRQRLGSSTKKSVATISVRVTMDEYNKIVEICKDRDVTLSEYIRASIIPVYSLMISSV
jgi:hypothetical protein